MDTSEETREHANMQLNRKGGFAYMRSENKGGEFSRGTVELGRGGEEDEEDEEEDDEQHYEPVNRGNKHKARLPPSVYTSDPSSAAKGEKVERT